MEALELLLRLANGNDVDSKAMKSIENFKDGCKLCHQVSTGPRGFKLTAGSQEIKFHLCVQIDSRFIGGRPVLYMIEEATHFCAASFLRNQAKKEILKLIQHMSCLVYMDHPEYIFLVQGSAYTSKGMKKALEAFGNGRNEAPIEMPGAIGTVKRYHTR